MEFLKPFVIDTHCDSIVWVVKGKSLRDNPGHLDLKRMHAVIKLQFFALFIESQFKPYRALERTLDLLDKFLLTLAENRDLLALVCSKSDLRRLPALESAGALVAVEGGEGIKNLATVRHLFRLGVRSIGLTWNQRNQLADGVLGGGGGLTELGKKVIKEMNRLGMLVDAAHMGPKSFWDTLRISEKPIIVSHANCRALCDHDRNLSDIQLKVLARNGGIFCLTLAPQFLSCEPAGLDTFLDHVAYAADLIGVEHIGIGSDFDGVGTLPEGINGVQDYFKIQEGLRLRGFNEKEIGTISGENVKRLLLQILPEKNEG